MLKQQMEQIITTNTMNNEIELLKIEQEYVQKHKILPSHIEIIPKEIEVQLVEICHKETEEVSETKSSSFANESIQYVHDHPESFLYIEAADFEKLGMTGIAIEMDDVFKTSTALFGLQLQKKYRNNLLSFLSSKLCGDFIPYSIQFSDKDGLWDVNIALDAIDGFSPSLTIQKTVELLYTFVFSMIETVEEIE